MILDYICQNYIKLNLLNEDLICTQFQVKKENLIFLRYLQILYKIGLFITKKKIELRLDDLINKKTDAKI